ncbi:hypothetical protein EV421DRAFT_1915327 [Armillaria borealis]|uniref:Uncharacterized protein n=1 Tax=Armillaria borealis TaxID=47425 RepID=A0AA39ICC8_9AGAR|nr:hypothetical protein EV421DRAFT_1915327 [Armillaria borealis]
MSIPPPSFMAGPPLAPTIPLNQRKNKTHSDNENKACLATWSLLCKRAMNTLVKADNKDRLDKHAEPGCSAASSLASLLTTEGSQHTSTLPTSPQKFFDHISAGSGQDHSEVEGALLRIPVDNSPEDVTKKCKKIFNCSEKVERQPGSSFQFEGYHAELYCLADTKQYIPLHLFTLTNIAIIHQEGDTLPMKKIQDRGHGKVMVLDVSNARFGKETDLMELQWQDASPRYVNFLSSL